MTQEKTADKHHRGQALAALGLGIFAASNLPSIWRADVYARGAGFIFLLWLVPLIWVAVRDYRAGKLRPDPLVFTLSFLACIVGILGSLNIARHVALGLALGGQTSSNVWKWLWLAGMLSWLPATGWLTRDLPGNGLPIRCTILALSVGASFPWWRGGRT